jgi:hypothetical protein
MVAGRNHAGAASARHEQVVRDLKVLDKSWRNGAATGLDAPSAVQQQNAVSFTRQLLRSGSASRTAAYDYDVKRFYVFHGITSRLTPKNAASLMLSEENANRFMAP